MCTRAGVAWSKGVAHKVTPLAFVAPVRTKQPISAERALVPFAPTSPDGVGAKTVPTNVEPEGGRIVESLIAGGEAESAEAAASSSGRPAELQQLLDGNARFAGLQVADPGKVLATVAEGQTPQVSSRHATALATRRTDRRVPSLPS